MVNHKSGKCRLEDFELLKVLGRGSFGKVHFLQAYVISNHVIVALSSR